MSQTRQKVLILSGLQVYPAESGGQLRTSSLADHLAAHGFDVAIFSLVGRKPDYLKNLASGTAQISEHVTEHVHRGKISALIQLVFYRLKLPPFWISWALRAWQPRKLRQMLAEAHHVIADFPFLAAAAHKAKRPYWLSTHNVEVNLLTDPWQKGVMTKIEQEAATKAQGVICCARGDQNHFAGLVGIDKTVYVPNGLRDDRFDGLSAERQRIRDELGIATEDRILIFTASIFAPNVEAFHQFLLPFVRAQQGLLEKRRLHVLVVGSVSSAAWKEPRLTVTGKVPRIEPYFVAADFALNATFRGSGTNVKMGEYMAAGLPILTTQAGRRGYDLTPGEDCILFDETNFAEVVAETWLFDDLSRAQMMAKGAYEKNRAVVSMKEAIRPLVDALRE